MGRQVWGAGLEKGTLGEPAGLLPSPAPEAAFSMERGAQGLATLLLEVKVTFLVWPVWG